MSPNSVVDSIMSWISSPAKRYRSGRMLPYSAEFHFVHEELPQAFHGFVLTKEITR